MTRGSTRIFGYGALAMATAVIASVSVPGCTPKNGRVAEPSVSAVAQVESPAKHQIWTGCELDDDTIDEMRRSGLKTPVFVVVYTSAEADPEGEHTGPVICINTAETRPPITVEQTDNIGGGDSTLDLLDLNNTGLRYRLNGRVEQRYCHAVGGASECLLFVQP